VVDATLQAARPVFGICRGFQELNVAFGGSLRRDTSTSEALLAHHAPADASYTEMFEHLHDVRLVPGGILAEAYGRSALHVNSVHFQGVEKLGMGLSVEATAPDGLVEAFSTHVNGAPVLAVQWHPEWGTDDQPESQTFFRLLGQALRGDSLVHVAEAV
jgi:putative glutamine amidotransferase